MRACQNHGALYRKPVSACLLGFLPLLLVACIPIARIDLDAGTHDAGKGTENGAASVAAHDAGPGSGITRSRAEGGISPVADASNAIVLDSGSSTSGGGLKGDASSGFGGAGGAMSVGTGGTTSAIDAAVDASSACGSASDRKNCGTCGHDCTALPNVVPTSVSCSAGACVVPQTSCRPTFAHCSSNPDDGCELLALTTAHCGGCNRACLPNSTCTAGLCDSQLGYSEKLCDGSYYGHSNYLAGYQLLVPQDATLLKFGAIPEIAGTFNFALYTDVGGRPGKLVAQTGDKQIGSGTAPIEVAVEYSVTPQNLLAGNYWLFFMMTSTNGGLCISSIASQKPIYQTYVTGLLPDPFPPDDPNTFASSQSPWNAYIVARMAGM